MQCGPEIYIGDPNVVEQNRIQHENCENIKGRSDMIKFFTLMFFGVMALAMAFFFLINLL